MRWSSVDGPAVPERLEWHYVVCRGWLPPRNITMSRAFFPTKLLSRNLHPKLGDCLGLRESRNC